MAVIAQSNDSRQKKASCDLPDVCNTLAIDFKSPEDLIRSLPFSGKDTTAGLENEFQTVVTGPADKVDLPLMIKESRYYRNMIKRARSGDNDKTLPERLRRYIEDNPGHVWENSWVRFDPERLSPYAGLVFKKDLLSDKSDPHSEERLDASAFFIRQGDENLIRIPVNYLLKLALADIIGTEPDTHSVIKVTGENLMRFYLSDNTSPEILSFYTCSHNRFSSVGEAVAGETMKRFLLTQILTRYANKKFGLSDRGQTVAVYFSATPPLRQKRLNDIIPDAFYRDLFMSPCLSGWDKGEEKKNYMGLCHRVLSRSQLNGVSKLRDAGIITRNLVVLPNMSNISLANNGTHVSLGSRKLSALLADKNSGFTADHEKMIGDLVIKITEHFIPLFVGSYSASPYRLSFTDFHPEKVLAFLPHELDFTHLRMIWRRWKKKASLKIMGKTVTPFGPEWLDRVTSRLFRLKGDMVPDYRLIDYFACLMSTDESPALDGRFGNDARLKEDLGAMGIFDPCMPLYLLCRMREYHTMGFSGFEARYFSMFHGFDDLAHAVNLQMLVTALAYQYVLTGQVTHGDIPDDPFTESERRQTVFGRAIGIPTFYVHKDSKNTFMSTVLQLTTKTRKSKRYPDYIRVVSEDYRKALFALLTRDGKALIRELGIKKSVKDLEQRLTHPHGNSVSSRINRDILDQLQAKSRKAVRSPMDVPADEYNRNAEVYFRDTLGKKHMKEALNHVTETFEAMELWVNYRETSYREALASLLGPEGPKAYLYRTADRLLSDRLNEDELLTLARLLILQIHFDRKRQNGGTGEKTNTAEARTAMPLKTV